MSDKTCTKCKTDKPLSEFYLIAKTGRPCSWCKSCQAKRYEEWKARNVEHRRGYDYAYHRDPRNQARRMVTRKSRWERSPRYVMVITLRHGLKRRPTENPATIDDLMRKWADQEGRCAVTGIEMTWNKGKVLPTSISLDRVDPEQGYSADNLRLICHAVNAFKGRMSDADMVEMAHAIVTKADVESQEPSWNSYLVPSHAQFI